MMENRILILSTTKAAGKDGLFSLSNKDVEKVGNQEIYRIKDELIFVRNLIITGDEPKKPTPAEVDKEIFAFTKQVVEHCNIENIETIIYFIHAKELQLYTSYKVLDKGDSRVKALEEQLKKEFSEKLGVFDIKFVAYKHGEPHFWSDFLYEDLKNKKPQSSWVETLEFCFNEKERLDHKNSAVKPLSLKIQGCIKRAAQKEGKAGGFSYYIKTFEKNKIIDTRSQTNGKADFQIINTSMITFSKEKNELNFLGEALGFNRRDKADFNPLPIIIIGEDDIMCDWGNLKDKDKLSTLKKLNIDKRYRFFDSNIWLRYVSKKKNQLGENLEQQLERVIGDIKEHLKNKTYKTNVAKEYIEYHYRLFQNSHLVEVGNGHASDVTPFMFHSETYMQKRADKLIQIFCAADVSWRLLLVDDFAKKELTIGDAPLAKSCSTNVYSKEKIIKDLVNKSASKTIFEINSTATVGVAVKFLKKEKITEEESVVVVECEGNKDLKKEKVEEDERYHYDAILLDYLFSNKEENKSRKAEYGTELLLKISEDAILRKAKAFNYKFWIYPVSVFSDALHSSLREQGVQHLEEDWVLGRGADPINTPQLFRYDFLDFIKVQYDGVLYETQDLIDLLLSDLIEEDENGPIDVRHWARRFYHSLWTKFGKSQSLVYDSLFTRSINKKREPHNDRKSFMIFEHLETILHNLAFASIFDFEGTEMTYLKLYEELMATYEKETKKKKEREDLRKQLKRLGEGIYGIHQ